MKYVVILPDGAHDEPCPELEGLTPLEAARIPNMDWIAAHGQLGRAVTIPAGFTAGTDVGTLTLLGYDPKLAHTGRAPIEAAARKLKVRDDQLIFRCNFVTLEDGRMADFTAGHINQRDADQLVNDLNEELERDGCQLFSGVSYRNLMLLDGAAGYKLVCAPPHDIPGQPVDGHLPTGTSADRVRRIMAKAGAILAGSAVNQARVARGEKRATNIWLWGQGRPMVLESFAARWKLRGAVISAVDIIRGFAVATGMKQIDVPGATGYIDTNFVGKGRAGVEALSSYDIVFVHVEAADEAGHLGDAREKVRALERIDEAVVGPILEELRQQPAWRVLVAADHPTPCTTKAHSAAPPLFAYAGSDVPAAKGGRFTEKDAEATGLFVDPGHTLMGTFLGR